MIRRDGKKYGYAHLWGMSAETALAVVDMLSTARRRRGPSGTRRSGPTSRASSSTRAATAAATTRTSCRRFCGAAGTRRTTTSSRATAGGSTPPEYTPLPVALLVNSGTASNAEALALKFRAHAIGPIVGETTAGMASGGAAAEPLSDGSTLWFSERAIESLDGKSYEGHGVAPDVPVADRPAAADGQEDAVVEAAIRALGCGQAVPGATH